MVSRISAAVFLTLLVAEGRAQFDFTPEETFYEIEGIREPNVTFRNGSQAITYSPPSGWKLSGGGRKLSLTPPDSVQAGAAMEVASGKDQLPAAAENVKAYSDLAVGLLPREATKVAVLEASVSPLRISNRPMIEVTVAYSFFGQQFRMNLLFLPHDTAQLRFQFSARAADFARLLRDFNGSLYSMQGL